MSAPDPSPPYTPALHSAFMNAARENIASRIRRTQQRGEQVARSILRARDPEQAFSEATQLGEAAQQIAAAAGRARALAAQRIAKEQGLTGPQLGALLGVSQARAYQLLATARAIQSADPGE